MICALLLSVVIYLPAQEQIQKDDYTFTFQNKLNCNPVENQANTGTCWSFSTGSYLESEAIRLGKQPIDLSEMYWVRKAYLEKAQKYLHYHGKSNFGQGGLSHDILRLYDQYGAMPESVYTGLVDGKTRHNHDKLQKDLLSYLDSLIRSKHIEPTWRSHVTAILDQHLGSCPESFTYDGKTLDPKAFAQEYIGINVDDYLTVTSFTHHPWYGTFVLEVPDNYSDGQYHNIPLLELQELLRRALALGHSIVWDCDVSETGFSARQGLALVPVDDQQVSTVDPFKEPHPEKLITAELRQAEFDSYALTDDHLMHIVGLASDQEGKLYYYVKNSWGDDRGFGGYLFASESYVLLNTIGLTLHKDALGTEILDRLEDGPGTSDD